MCVSSRPTSDARSGSSPDNSGRSEDGPLSDPKRSIRGSMSAIARILDVLAGWPEWLGVARSRHGPSSRNKIGLPDKVSLGN